MKIFNNLFEKLTYLFFDHSKLLVNRFEMESVESRSVEKSFEISQVDFSDFLVDRRHEGSHWSIGEV